MTPSLNWLLLPLLLAWSAAVYWVGDHNRNNAWLAKQAAAEQQAHQAYVAEVARGQAAASQSVSEQQKLQKNYSLLEGKFHELRSRGPLVVFKNQTPASAQAGGAAVSLAATGTDSLPGTPGAGAVGSIALSLGAVWMWNSALTGIDTPAGTCGAVDIATAACTADSGIGFEAAWENHATNAKSCALDRARHQRLIDYVSTTPNGPTHGF